MHLLVVTVASIIFCFVGQMAGVRNNVISV